MARGIRVKNDVEYSVLWVNERGLRQALAVPHLHVDASCDFMRRTRFRRASSAHTEENRQKNVAIIRLCKSLKISVTEASISSAFGCNLKVTVARDDVLLLSERRSATFTENDCALDQLILADTMAWATPLSVQRLVGAIRDKHPKLVLRLHLHDTRGMAIANAFAVSRRAFVSSTDQWPALAVARLPCTKARLADVCTEDFRLHVR